MRKVILLAALFFISRFAMAQAYDGTVEFQKNKQAAATMELPYPPGVVEDAIKERMKKAGYSGKESKGFITYKGVKDLQTGKEMDYIFKVERKSRKEKDETVVYLFAQGSGVDMSATGDGSDMNFLKTHLNNMQPDVEAYNLELQIAGQEDNVKKAEKKYDNLQDDLKSMEKKLKKLQDDMEENKRDQEKQKGEIENQKKILDTLKGKRKTN